MDDGGRGAGGSHSPPLAYSMIRYKVFSVSITSNSWTVTHDGRDVSTRAVHTIEFHTGESLTYVGMVECFHDAHFTVQLRK